MRMRRHAGIGEIDVPSIQEFCPAADGDQERGVAVLGHTDRRRI